jgi:hypothetical protein
MHGMHQSLSYISNSSWRSRSNGLRKIESIAFGLRAQLSSLLTQLRDGLHYVRPVPLSLVENTKFRFMLAIHLCPAPTRISEMQ